MYETINPFQLVLGGSILIFILSGLFIILYYHFSRKIVLQRLEQNYLIVEHQKDLLKNEIATTEKERKRIAQDLHDEIGANLAYIGLNLTQIGKECTSNNSLHNKLKICSTQLNKAITDVRRISHDLLPPVLEMFGLIPAVREFLDQLETCINVDYNAHESFNELSSETALQLYRVILELVNNSIKHAKCSKISLEMINQYNKKEIIIKDNGIGFNFEEMNKNTGLGLKNIVSRLESINAEYRFQSNSPKGSLTIITLK